MKLSSESHTPTPRQSFDAPAYLYQRYVRGNVEMENYAIEEHERVVLGSDLCRIRETAGWTYEQLAEQVGTTGAEIERLEDADYEDIPLSLFRKIAAISGSRLEIRLVPNSPQENGG